MRISGKASVVAMFAAVVSAASMIGCGGAEATASGDAANENVGSAGLALKLPPDVSIDAASYVITGPNAFTKTGDVNLSQSTTLTALIAGIPSGAGYSISIRATSSNGSVSCVGSAGFAVVAHSTAQVTVHLACRETPRSGSVSVQGTLNICPSLDGVNANPQEVLVGGSVALSAAAHDSDSGPSALSYQWSAASGSFDSATSSHPAFRCTVAGTVAISVTVSDGDNAAGCADSQTVDVTCSLPGSGSSSARFTAAVYGDAPYGVNQADTSQTLATPAFIDAVNADPSVSLVMHVGDIHSGKQFCTESYDRTVFDLWKAYADPLVYTPGDNEWSDCHKTAEGGGAYNSATGEIAYVLDATGNPVDYAKGDPIANLALIRSIFFASPGVALGGGKKPVLSQANFHDPAYPSDANYVENVMWQDSKVLFVIINLPGGSNNDTDVWYGAPTATVAQTTEVSERTGADLRWLDTAFAQAQGAGAVGVVIMAQADMWDPEKGAAHQAGYEPFVSKVAAKTLAFGKPVLMLNGDSHVYLSGNPLSPSDVNYGVHPGYDVPNFHRIVVHGSTKPLEYMHLTIDPAVNAPAADFAFGPFSWDRVIR